MAFPEFLKHIVFDKTFKQKVDFLAQVPLFSGLSRRSLGKFVSVMHEKHYGEGDVVFSEGQEGKVFYIVKSGKVSVTSGGKVLCALGPGNYFGEMALLEEMPRTATVTAVEATELYLIYKVKFDALIENSPGMGVRIVRALASLLSERLRQAGGHQPSCVSDGNASCKE